MKKILLMLVLGLGISGFAQNPPCSSTTVTNDLIAQHPEIAERIADINAAVKAKYGST